MMSRALGAELSCALMLAGTLCAMPAFAQTSLQAAQADLLRNAEMWAARQRFDLARQSIDKLLALQPDSPQALAVLGDIALRENQPAEAQRILRQLRERHPRDAATADLATLIRVNGPDQEKLARMRLLARAGRKPEAAEVARELFPDGPPVLGGLALEYYQIVGGAPRSGAQAAQALDRLYERTGDAGYRLAQLELRMGQGANANALAREFESLAAEPTVDAYRLRDLWRRTLDRMDAGAAAEPRLRAYLRRYPDDKAVTDLLTVSREAVARAERWARDPARLAQVAADKALDAGDLARAEQELNTALALRPRDADSLGNLGRVRLRQGRHEDAQRLFAEAHRISGDHKWSDLQGTARFWGLLQQSDEAAEQGRITEADRFAAQALALQPQNAEALATLAGLRARQGDPSAAQALYEQALQADPAHRGAWRGLAAALVAAGRPEEAMTRLEDAARQVPGQAEAFNAIRASLLSDQAEAQLAAQHTGPALRLLESAVPLAPRDAWLRHRLARAYLQLGQPREALVVMDEGIAVGGDQVDMRYARALIRSAAGDDAGALADLEYISPEQRSDSMRALLRTATVYSTVARAEASGADAAALLARAEREAGDDADLLYAVANAWFRRGEPARGVAVFDRFAERSKAQEPAVRLEHAALLGRAAADVRLEALLPALIAEPGWTPEQAERLLAVQTAHLERRAEAAVAAGDRAEARRVALSPLLPNDVLPPARMAYARGRLLLAAQDWVGASRELEQALPGMNDNAEAHLALGDAYARQGREAQAREQALWLQGHLPADGVGDQLALLRLWQRIPAMDEARTLSQRLLGLYPRDTDVLLHTARLERADDRYAQSLAYFREALDTETGPPQDRAKIEQDIAAIEARRQAWVEFGMERLQKHSTSGISTLRGWERPAVAWMPKGYDGHHFLHVDQVQLDAGALPASAADARDYGQVAAWPASAYPADPGRPRGNGFNVGFGYQGRGVEWDIGATGIGLPVTNLVGGISRSEWSEDFSYRIEISRRPLTGSLLSYAGAHDPITGQVWGGVVATGVSGRVSRPVGGYSASFSAGYALLQGRNVQDNTRLQLRAAIDSDVLSTAHSTLNVGAALAAWSYARDLSEFTWSHGGYYSPRRYISLALPVEWGGRQGAFTWLVRGSVSVSQSSSHASDYYPGRPDLQAQARALGNGPVFAGGGSSGFGRSLRAAVEYQATRNLALGAQLSIERADYYAPTTALFYLRYLLDPVRAPQPDRPRPVQTYSSF